MPQLFTVREVDLDDRSVGLLGAYPVGLFPGDVVELPANLGFARLSFELPMESLLGRASIGDVLRL